MTIFGKPSPSPESPNLANAAALAGLKLTPLEVKALELYCASFKAGWEYPGVYAVSILALIFLPEQIRNILWPVDPGNPEKLLKVNKAIVELRALIGIPEEVTK
jgi:hypothetical protein